MRFLFILLLLFPCLSGSAQNMGSISGSIREEQTGSEIIAANVLVVETASGTVSDLDGNYQIRLPAGRYTLEISYIGFATRRLSGVELKAGEISHLDIVLTETGIGAGTEVLVESRALLNNEAALLSTQRLSAVVQDGISAQQMQRTGERSAASALQRLPAVSIQHGKYVYLRGLGDRYSKTTLNGIELPALDPNRNSAQLDLLPTAALDNIVVYKTFSPDLYADFAGGYIELNTKDFPEQFMLNFSAGFSFNTSAHGSSERLAYANPSPTHVLGFGANQHALPATVASYTQNNTRTWGYQERAISATQLRGQHYFPALQKLELRWQADYVKSSQQEPDLRYFTNRYSEDADLYFIKPSSDRLPSSSVGLVS